MKNKRSYKDKVTFLKVIGNWNDSAEETARLHSRVWRDLLFGVH